MAIVALTEDAAMNRRLCEIIGYTADELLTLRFQDITPS